jgi:hypothetical protein
MVSRPAGIWVERGIQPHPLPPFLGGDQPRSRELSELADAFNKVCERWSVETTQAVRLLHMEEEEALCKLILRGEIRPFTGDLRDRMALIVGISIGLIQLFGSNREAERVWLNRRIEVFGRSPLEHMFQGNMQNLHSVSGFLDKVRNVK